MYKTKTVHVYKEKYDWLTIIDWSGIRKPELGCILRMDEWNTENI